MKKMFFLFVVILMSSVVAISQELEVTASAFVDEETKKIVFVGNGEDYCVPYQWVVSLKCLLGGTETTVVKDFRGTAVIQWDYDTLAAYHVQFSAADPATGRIGVANLEIDPHQVVPTLGAVQISGDVLDPQGRGIKDAVITIQDGLQQKTQQDGFFVFYGQDDYVIKAEKDGNHLNGVSTFDLVLISKHILGINSFDTPYEYIAADINKSGTITAFDLVQLRQLILGISKKFPNNTSWRFVDACYQFDNDRPLQVSYPDTIALQAVGVDRGQVDFVGIKVGDVNRSSDPSRFAPQGTKLRRSQTPFMISIPDRKVLTGEEFEVTFTSKQVQKVLGFQCELKFKDLEVIDLGEDEVKESNIHLTRNSIRVSWNDEARKSDLFRIRFRAKKKGKLSEFISLSSDFRSEAYSNLSKLMPVVLSFTSQEVKSQPIAPYMNQNEWFIPFSLKTPAQIVLKVFDIRGKLVFSLKNKFPAGNFTIQIAAHNVKNDAVLFYQLFDGKKKIRVGKMIHISEDHLPALRSL